mgnify:FL=1
MSLLPVSSKHSSLPLIKLGVLLLTLNITTPVWAQVISSPLVQVNMLEVYTSQGCSSCPPAERWMSKFKDDSRLWKQLVPMNFHVDYWDYLGWPDPYASKIFTQRQRDYKRLKLSPTVATPGFIMAGEGWNGWFRRKPVPLKPYKAVGVLRAKIEDGVAQVDFNPTQNHANTLQLYVAILGFDQLTQVLAGENSGKALPHDFVVMGYKRTDMKNTKGEFGAQLTLPNVSRFNSPRKALVFWVSHKGDPTPIQVAADWY